LISLAAFSVPLLSIHHTKILAEPFFAGAPGTSLPPTARLTHLIISEGGERTINFWAVLMHTPVCLQES
jgi:hypothetical protein